MQTGCTAELANSNNLALSLSRSHQSLDSSRPGVIVFAQTPENIVRSSPAFYVNSSSSDFCKARKFILLLLIRVQSAIIPLSQLL